MVRKGAHCVFHIRYHIVIIPKYRKPILKASIRAYMYFLIRKFCKEFDLKIVELALVPDHVHLFVDATPKYSPAQIVQMLKSITAREIFKKYPKPREQYWAGEFFTGKEKASQIPLKERDVKFQSIKNSDDLLKKNGVIKKQMM